MKKFVLGCFTSILIFAVIISAFVIWIINLPEHQNPPQILAGEFPFVVEYELNGEKYIIEDVVICEFDDYDYSAWFTKPRSWNTYLKSGNEEKRILLKSENSYSILEPDRINILSSVVLNYGAAEYYMGDPNFKNMIYAKPFFYYSERYNIDNRTEMNTGTELSCEELEQYFNIKVVRFEFAEPIKNQFK